MNKNEKIFHESAGMASPHYKAPTPFQIIGGDVKEVVKDIKKAGKKVGKFLDTQFIKPSRDYNKIQKAKDEENRRKGEAGLFN